MVGARVGPTDTFVVFVLPEDLARLLVETLAEEALASPDSAVQAQVGADDWQDTHPKSRGALQLGWPRERCWKGDLARGGRGRGAHRDRAMDVRGVR
tara:strand:- start:200 stop:490 length:291 start_codon:yes stop_codon:yes gene_type:complete